MIDQLTALDQDVFLYLNHLGSKQWDWLWLIITNKWTFIPLYAFLIYLLYRNLNLKTTIYILVFVALMITCTDQLANVFKDGFQRLRPCNLDIGARVVARCGRYSFFSAHAASTMALAIFIGSILKHYYKYAKPSLIIWSLIVGYSRIYVGVHYPGDLIVGFIIGGLIGYIIYKIQAFILKKYLPKFKQIGQ